jgi:hypothetical protein
MALELPAYARMRQIIGSAAEWSANDLVIGDGEVAILRRAAGLLTIRIGDGATPFSGLRDLTTITATFVDSDGVTDNSAATRTFITVPIVDTGAQIFAAGALITVDNKLPVRPEWFSSNARVDLAVFCLPSPGGGVVQLADRVYPSPGDTALLGRSNYTIRGVRRPNFNAAYTGLENGSIVQGPFTFRGDNVTLEHFGVDSGSVVVGALYGGTAKDGFLSGLPVATRNKNLRMFVLVALCKDATSLVHAFCLEGYTNSEINQLKSAFGVHGVSLKNTDTNVSNILARGHGFDGVIVKSDTATTTAGSMNLTNIVCGSINAYDGGGLRVTNTAGGQSLTGVTIRNLQCDRTLYGIDFECNDTHLLDSVEVDGAFVLVPQTYGFRNSGQARRCKVRGLVLFNPGGAGVITSRAVGTGSGDGVPEIDFTDVHSLDELRLG